MLTLISVLHIISEEQVEGEGLPARRHSSASLEEAGVLQITLTVHLLFKQTQREGGEQNLWLEVPLLSLISYSAS